MPWRMRPPSSARASNSVTRQPRRRSWNAADSPAGPPPTTATWPLRPEAGASRRQPCAMAVSPTKRSSLQMASDSSWPARLQAASQGWWQMRPAMAGNGLWRASTSKAPRQSRSRASAIHSAMSPFTGQAWWQGDGAWMWRGSAARQVPVLKTSVEPVVQIGGSTAGPAVTTPPPRAAGCRPGASLLRRRPRWRPAAWGCAAAAWPAAPAARVRPPRARRRRAAPN